MDEGKPGCNSRERMTESWMMSVMLRNLHIYKYTHSPHTYNKA